MKLFQIEEPEGPPLDSSGPGAAVGIALGKAPHATLAGIIAFAVGGNAEILPGGDGERMLAGDDLGALLLGLRARAEKQLARPVTHAVIALPPIEEGPLAVAAIAAGLALLDTLDVGTAPLENAALEAALRAEDLAPKT
ncbi:MAG TPA: hypothetical protein VNF99_21140 [Stellaceae bacterium]|nr:hypothetical protein [Stellaceae bacterium]